MPSASPQPKLYVLDTNVILHDSGCIRNFEEHDIAIPISLIRNGNGPTALLMAGNHGDEYEGQIALCKLVRELDPGAIQGRVIILPAANLPAALAGARVSPIDDGNLNRAFPGDADGTPTFAIAHYIDSVLYPMADFCHDLHSGGSSLQYLPFASMRRSDKLDLDARALAALKAFGAPIGSIWAYSPDRRLSSVAAVDRGVGRQRRPVAAHARPGGRPRRHAGADPQADQE